MSTQEHGSSLFERKKYNLLHLHFKQHAYRFMLTFMKILIMYLKVKYCEVNKENNLNIAKKHLQSI
jgi:hypothetical protein